MTQDNRRHTSGPKSVSTKKANTPGAEAKKRYNNKAYYIARAKEAGIENPERFTTKALKSQLKELKKQGKLKDKRLEGHNNGGRKPLDETKRWQNATELFEMHMNEIVDVIVHNKQTGQYTTTKVATLKAMLDKLRQKALQEGDVRAIVAYMERVIGKPKQMVEHSGSIKQDEQRVPTEAELRATKAFLAELDKA